MGKIVSKEVLLKFMDSTDYVEDIAKNNAFIYSNAFYLDLYRKLEEGLSDVQAYEALGFDTKELGVDRAYSACRYARRLAKDKSFKINPKNYDGSLTRDELGELSPEEELAYLKSRNRYLEAVVDLQKKTSEILEMRDAWSKKK